MTYIILILDLHAALLFLHYYDITSFPNQLFVFEFIKIKNNLTDNFIPIYF